jgi:CubicO group peptidase (beta-lactamase class C family)
MQGFPPAAPTQVTLANWRKAPFNKWGFQHARDIVPSADIANDPEAVWHLPFAPHDFGGLTINSAGRTLAFEAFLKETDTDGLVILHKGAVAAEIYSTGMTRYVPHILMSVSKSLLGILAGILVDRGALAPSKPVTDYVPEVATTAYAGASVRELLDMRVGILFDENYLASSGPIIAYRKAQGWDPRSDGEPLSDLRSFYQTLTERDGLHGDKFHYVSPNTDLLGWVIERATGDRYADLMSELLWRPLGASYGAYITVDRLGAPRCAGGMCATLLDLGRLGQLVAQGGCHDGRRIIPQLWLDDILANGDAGAWKDGDFAKYFPGAPIHYRSKWYVLRGEAPLLFCVGVHGQNLFVDPINEIVIAKFSSHAMPMDEARISLTMDGVAAVRRHLGAHV